MPVTVKFSQEFYDKLGHAVADELVDWFNKADDTYRTDLRELNELNYARFAAQLDRRFADQDANWERRFADQDAKWERRFADQDAKWERRFADLRVELARQKADLIKWMFGFWAPTAVGVIALLLK